MSSRSSDVDKESLHPDPPSTRQRQQSTSRTSESTPVPLAGGTGATTSGTAPLNRTTTPSGPLPMKLSTTSRTKLRTPPSLNPAHKTAPFRVCSLRTRVKPPRPLMTLTPTGMLKVLPFQALWIATPTEAQPSLPPQARVLLLARI